jgi:hypothetical protein
MLWSFSQGYERLLLVASKEFSRRREFGKVRIGGWPNRQELFVSLFGGFGIALKLLSAGKPKY